MTDAVNSPDAVNELTGPRSPMQEMPASGPQFEFERPVRTGDVDADERLRLDGIGRYLQDIASDHAAATSSMADQVWILRRTVIDVLGPVGWPARVRLRRWCSAMSTRWATMRVDITAGAGGRVESEGFWININPETGMPTRISEGLERDLMARTAEHRLRWRPLLKEAAPEIEAAGVAEAGVVEAGVVEAPFPLRFTDIDPMRHLNNTVYLQAVEGLLAAHADLRAAPHRMIIEYLRPILAGAALVTRSRRDEDGLGVWFLVDGVEHARARVLGL